jgi:transposase
VKTDRRDAQKLARCYRAGELTPAWVPDAKHEAWRELVRAREAAKKDQPRHRRRLGKFLLRHGQRPIDAGKAWTQKYLDWIRIHVHFEQPALEATVKHYREEVDHSTERIVKLEQAIDETVKQAPAEIGTVVAELGSLAGFESPRQWMGYSGLTPREYSSGHRVQRGALTKSGHAHLRRVLVEAAWTYRHRPNVQGRVRRRQKPLALGEEAQRIAWKAQQRLHKRFTALSARGKNHNQIVTALARELLGFLWAIAVHTEAQFQLRQAASACEI